MKAKALILGVVIISSIGCFEPTDCANEQQSYDEATDFIAHNCPNTSEEVCNLARQNQQDAENALVNCPGSGSDRTFLVIVR